MPAESRGLSDKAAAVFAFATYHQLESGQRVSKIVRRDGAGHKADKEAVSELTARGLLRAGGEHLHFTSEGETVLQAVIAGLQRALNAG